MLGSIFHTWSVKTWHLGPSESPCGFWRLRTTLTPPRRIWKYGFLGLGIGVTSSVRDVDVFRKGKWCRNGRIFYWDVFNITISVLPYHVLTVSIATDGRIYVVYDLNIINMQVQPIYILDFYMLFWLPHTRCETETTVISCLLLSHADCNIITAIYCQAETAFDV